MMLHGKAMRMAVVGAMLMAMTGLCGCEQLTQLMDSVKAGLSGTQLDLGGLASLLSTTTKSASAAADETWAEDDPESWGTTDYTRTDRAADY